MRPISNLLAAAAVALIVSPAAGQQVTLDTDESEDHGTFLTDGEGMALYMFEADTQGEGDQEATSACYDDCAEAWPPLMGSEAEASGEAQSDLVGTIERDDGQSQVTYNGWPLYYFVQDQQPGDTSGHDVEGHGGEWYLLTPEGEQVQ